MPPAVAPRLLVIRRRYLGDVVLLGSVFRNLKLRWPDACLTVLVEPAYVGVLPLHPDVDETLAFPAGGGWWPFLRALRAGRFTHVLDFDNTDKTAWLTRFTGAAHRVTFDRDASPVRHRWAYTQAVAFPNAEYDRQHITETYLRLLAAIGVPVATREIRLVPRPDDLAVARRSLPPSLTHPGRALLVHPGSRSEFRLWPADRFAAVITRVQRELGRPVALIAGPGEKQLAAGIASACAERPFVFDATPPVPQLAALMSLFPIMLCHDSGPMHLAAGVGARIVALCGSQNMTIWGPVGPGHRVLQTALPCPCLSDTPQPCVKADSYRSYCVRRLGVDEVFAAVRERLAAAD